MDSRQKTLNRISKLKSIESKKLYTYELTHLYDIDKTPLVFSVHIAPSVISPLMAYIEFIQEEHGDESWAIGKDSIVKVINELYSHVDYENINHSLYSIDHYYNREYWCGTELASEYNPFMRRELVSLVIDVVNEEKEKYEASKLEEVI